MQISDAEVIHELTASGAKVTDYFIIESEIYAINNSGQLVTLLVDNLPHEEDGEMHMAILGYLRRCGVTEYASREQFDARVRR